MGKKRTKKELAELSAQRQRNVRIGIIAAVIVIAVIVIIAIVASLREVEQRTAKINTDGNLVIPISKVKDEFHVFSYGETQEMLVWREAEGVYHTAFNTCEECYATGRAGYTFQNGVLTCQACGNTMNVSDMGNNAWGGCQPVAIPQEYRTDTDTEIVIPTAVLQYSDDMFGMWDNGDYSITLENYEG